MCPSGATSTRATPPSLLSGPYRPGNVALLEPAGTSRAAFEPLRTAGSGFGGIAL